MVGRAAAVTAPWVTALWVAALAGCGPSGEGDREAGGDVGDVGDAGGEGVGDAVLGNGPTPGDSVGLLVRGRIREDTVVLEPVFRVPPPADPPRRRQGPHRVRMTDARGKAVAEAGFEAAPVADLPGGREAHFSLVLPLGPGEASRLHRVSVSADGLESSRTARMTAREAREALRGEDAVEARARPDGRVRVRWDGERFPWALLREAGPEPSPEAGSGSIVAFARGGEATVRTGAQRLEVVLSDGVQSAARTVTVAP